MGQIPPGSLVASSVIDLAYLSKSDVGTAIGADALLISTLTHVGCIPRKNDYGTDALLNIPMNHLRIENAICVETISMTFHLLSTVDKIIILSPKRLNASSFDEQPT